MTRKTSNMTIPSNMRQGTPCLICGGAGVSDFFFAALYFPIGPDSTRIARGLLRWLIHEGCHCGFRSPAGRMFWLGAVRRETRTAAIDCTGLDAAELRGIARTRWSSSRQFSSQMLAGQLYGPGRAGGPGGADERGPSRGSYLRFPSRSASLRRRATLPLSRQYGEISDTEAVYCDSLVGCESDRCHGAGSRDATGVAEVEQPRAKELKQ